MSSKFRLLMTTDTTNEIWKYTMILCEALSRFINVEILLISAGGRPSKQQVDQFQKNNLNIIFTDFMLDMPKDYSRYQANITGFGDQLNEAIKEFNPHIVHLNHYVKNQIKSKNVPILLVCHGDVINQLKWSENKGKDCHVHNNIMKYKDIISKELREANSVVTLSRFAAESLAGIYDFSGEIKVIYNGINHEPSTIMPENPSIITTARYLNKEDNLHLFTRIIPKIPASIKICFAGERPLNKIPEKKVIYLGNLSSAELKEAYNQSSIYVALSVWDIFGFNQIEAAYSHCAIIANDIPIYREFWGDCACMFDRNNENYLIRSINNLVENKQLLNFTAKKCQAKALSAFNAKRMAIEYINQYKSLLQKYAYALKG